MDINDLRIFQMVAHEQSFSKAAEKLGYVQSNVTLRIKKLEQELHTTLFLRNNKGVSISQDGRKLLVYAEQIIQLLDDATAEFLPIITNQPLRLGATQTLAASRLPKFLSIFDKKYPDTPLSLKTTSQQHLLEQVLDKKLDGAFISGNYKDNNIETVISFKEEVAIISAASHQNIATLRNKPIIVNSFSDCPYRVLLEKWIIMNRNTTIKIFEFDTLESIIKSVAEDMGISLLPKSVIPNDNCIFVHELPSTFNELTTQFVICKNYKISHSLHNFIKILSFN